ncbi:MAG: PDZ domain-containing protein [Spartobacteria bacterium]|nr:PDZ domain-containing protein [Spartobacteria bacterium]
MKYTPVKSAVSRFALASLLLIQNPSGFVAATPSDASPETDDIVRGSVLYCSGVRGAGSTHVGSNATHGDLVAGAYQAMANAVYAKLYDPATQTVRKAGIRFEGNPVDGTAGALSPPTVKAISFPDGSTFVVPETVPNIQGMKEHCLRVGEVAAMLSYFSGIPAFELLERATSGALKRLDPHSDYIAAKDVPVFLQGLKGSFVGAGFQFRMNGDGQPEVHKVYDGSPAQRYGLQVGDVITDIYPDGDTSRKPVTTQNLDITAIQELILGPDGSEVSFSVRRDGQAHAINIVRGNVVVPAVEARLLSDAGGVGYIRLSTFSAQATTGLHKAIKELDAQSEASEGTLRAIILDLQGNPGGRLGEAISVTDTFLDVGPDGEGLPIVSYGKPHKIIDRFSSRPGDLTNGRPLIILQNGASGSASEIVAGALQDSGRSSVIGMPTFGKGSIQNIHVPEAWAAKSVVDSAGYLKVTEALFFPGSAGSNQGSGVIPDIEVRYNDERDDPDAVRHERDLPHSIVPAGNRSGQKSGLVCSLRAEFSGALRNEAAEGIPGELLEKQFEQNADSGKWVEVTRVNAPLACAIGYIAGWVSPYVEFARAAAAVEKGEYTINWPEPLPWQAVGRAEAREGGARAPASPVPAPFGS